MIQCTKQSLSECLSSDKVTMIVVQYLDHASQIQDYFKSNGFYIPIISGMILMNRFTKILLMAKCNGLSQPLLLRKEPIYR